MVRHGAMTIKYSTFQTVTSKRKRRLALWGGLRERDKLGRDLAIPSRGSSFLLGKRLVQSRRCHYGRQVFVRHLKRHASEQISIKTPSLFVYHHYLSRLNRERFFIAAEEEDDIDLDAERQEIKSMPFCPITRLRY